MKIFSVICLLLAAKLLSAADSTDSEKSKSGIYPVPVIIYSPETGFAGGAALYYFNYPNPEASRPHEIYGYGIYTEKKQIVISPDLIYFTVDSTQMFITDFKFSHFPDKFYGIGNNTQKENEEDFTRKQLWFRSKYLFLYKDLVYYGPSYRYFNYGVEDKAEGGILSGNSVHGHDGTQASGLGLHFFVDETDSPFFPAKGYYWTYDFHYFPEFLGSDSNFWTFELDARYYKEIMQNHVLAGQITLESSGGDVPFQLMPWLGDEDIMRGFYKGRYIDKHYYAAQIEYRYPVYWRFSGTVFGAIGDVGSDLGDFSTGTIKGAYGLGLRFLLDRSRNLRIRIDMAKSPEKLQFYFNVKEAF